VVNEIRRRRTPARTVAKAWRSRRGCRGGGSPSLISSIKVAAPTGDQSPHSALVPAAPHPCCHGLPRIRSSACGGRAASTSSHPRRAQTTRHSTNPYPLSSDIENRATSDTENCATPDPVWGLVSGVVPPWLRRRCLCLLMVFGIGCVGCRLSLMPVELFRLFFPQTSLVGVGSGKPPMPRALVAVFTERNTKSAAAMAGSTAVEKWRLRPRHWAGLRSQPAGGGACRVSGGY
jgi:hypothetical protein